MNFMYVYELIQKRGYSQEKASCRIAIKSA